MSDVAPAPLPDLGLDTIPLFGDPTAAGAETLAFRALRGPVRPAGCWRRAFAGPGT